MDKYNQKACLDFISGRSSVSQENELLESLSSGEITLEDFHAVEQIWLAVMNPSSDQVRGFNTIKGRLHHRTGRIISLITAVSAVAASVLMLFIHGSKEQEVKLPDYIALSTERQEIRTITLPDGSTVRLGPASELIYPAGFATGREVSLTGEAFFEVVSDPDSPFVVNAAGNKVTVVGTRFDISAYPCDPEVRTVLVEGKVVFSNNNMSVTLKPGEVLSYGTVTGELSKSSVNVNQYLGWMSGHLNYDKISLEKLFVRLSATYDMDIRYSPVKYADSSFRISLNIKEPIENVLQAVATITPISWSIDGNTISIKEK